MARVSLAARAYETHVAASRRILLLFRSDSVYVRYGEELNAGFTERDIPAFRRMLPKHSRKPARTRPWQHEGETRNVRVLRMTELLYLDM